MGPVLLVPGTGQDSSAHEILLEFIAGHAEALPDLEQPHTFRLSGQVASQGAYQAGQKARPHHGMLARHRVLDADRVDRRFQDICESLVDEAVGDRLRVAEVGKHVGETRSRSDGQVGLAER